MTAMLAKLIYWLFCCLALMSLLPLGYVLTHPGMQFGIWIISYAAIGSALWLLGRSFRKMILG